MARLIPAKCPQCAASVNVDPKQDVVRCDYCGTTSFIDRPQRQAPPNMPVMHLPQQPSSGGAVTGVLISTTLVGLVIAGVIFGVTRSENSPQASSDEETTTTPTQTKKAPKPEEKIHLLMGAPLAADVDGDGNEEIIVRIRRGRTKAHAAYDPATGKMDWVTDDPDLGHSTRSMVGAGRLVAADGKGQLTAYLLRDGKKQWTTSLGEKLEHFCEGDDDSILVLTKAKEVMRIDPASGGQTAEPSEECNAIVASGSSMRPGMSNPRDRRDYGAPPGVEGYECGSVRVTGSATYSVPDRCKKEGLALQALDGMTASRIWRDDDAFIVLGYKRPGTRTPMVARAKARSSKAEWSAVVPTGNPLDASPGAPAAATLAGDLLVVSWSKGTTAFDKNTGERQWSTDGTAAALVAAGDHVVAWSRTSLKVLDAKTGKEIQSLGI